MKMHSRFVTSVAVAKLPRFGEVLPNLKQDAAAIVAQDSLGQAWSKKNYWAGYSSYGSMSRLDLFFPSFAELSKLLLPRVKLFAKHLGLKGSAKLLSLDSMWLNVMQKGCYHSWHVHPLSVISGTVYLQCPKGSAPLKFEDPRFSLMMARPQEFLENPFWTVEPQVSQVVLWESYLRHEVPAHRLKTPRISVSFNYGIQGDR